MKKKRHTANRLDKGFISSKADGARSKLHEMKEKMRANDCRDMRLERSEELNPDDFE